MKKEDYPGIDLSPDELAAVKKFQAWVQEKRWQATLAPYYARVDAEFVELDPDERQRLAENLYAQRRAAQQRERLATVRKAE